MMLSKSASKTIKKLDRPRPLKWMTDSAPSLATSTSEGSEDVWYELESLVKHLSNSNIDNTLNGSILKVCRDLKHYGGILENRNTVQLDRYFVVLRNAARDERIDALCRLHLLEIIELRASGWKSSDVLDNYCKHKLYETENSDPNRIVSVPAPFNPVSATTANPTANALMNSHSSSSLSVLSSANPQLQTMSILLPGEVLKSSGKYNKPTKIPAKNYFKDEIVIRNSDSGKVMGIKGRRVHMIEELSGTIVSFQRVAQGAKDRLVQITGPSDEAIGRAKQLIEETIRRNTSPIRDRTYPLQTSESTSNLWSAASHGDDNGAIRPSLMHSLSMNDATIGEYQYTVNVGRDRLKLSGCRLDVVRTAKLVLEEYFAGDAKRTLHESVEDDDIRSFTPVDEEEERPPSDLPELTSVKLSNNLNMNFDDADKVSNHSTTITSSLSWLERNGHRLGKSSRITGRCISHDSTPDSDDDLFKSSVEEVNDVDDEEEEEDEDDSEEYSTCQPVFLSSVKSVTQTRIHVYTRDFLLECALSPYSRHVPKALPRIIQEIPIILKKTSDFFDPHAYKRTPLSSVSLVNFSSSSTTSNYWPYPRGGSIGSQDAEDEDTQSAS